MRLYLSNVLVCVLLLTGCAFDEGKPWGEASFAVEVAFDPPHSSLTDGRLELESGRLVEIDELTVTFESVALEIETTESGEEESSDEHGHSHGGEAAHADDDDEAGDGAAGVTQALDTVRLTASPRRVPSGECSAGCLLEPGSLAHVALTIHSVHVVGSIADPGEDPYDIELDVDAEATVEVTVDGVVGRGEPGGVDVAVSWELPASFLDGYHVEIEDDELAASVRHEIEEAGMEVVVDRHEL